MRTLGWTAAATALTAAVGSLGVDPNGRWYRRLRKPPWQPPPAAFGLVWTPVYGLIAIGTARLLDAEADPHRRKQLSALIATNLGVNAAWCWAFFRARRPSTSVALIVALDVLNAALLREAARRDGVAAACLAPYAACTAFATALNAEIARLNH